MSKAPLRFLFREIEWGFLEKVRREPTFLEGFIVGLVVFGLSNETIYLANPETEDQQKRRKLGLLLRIIYDEMKVERLSGDTVFKNNDVIVDMNVMEFDAGYLESHTFDLTKFRGTLKINYHSYWAKTMRPILSGEIKQKNLIGPNSVAGVFVRHNIPFLPPVDTSPSEFGMACFFLQGLEKLIAEITIEARPTLLQRILRWWKSR